MWGIIDPLVIYGGWEQPHRIGGCILLIFSGYLKDLFICINKVVTYR